MKTVTIDWTDLHAILVSQGYPLPSLFHCLPTNANNNRGYVDQLIITFDEQHLEQRATVAPLVGRVAAFKTRRASASPDTRLDLS